MNVQSAIVFVGAQLLCHQSDFDILTTAGLYSQLAGVLAGFAFAALTLILSVHLAEGARRDPADTRESRLRAHQAQADAALVLTVAVVSLVLSAVAYAVLAGGRTSGSRSASEELIAGAGLVTSVTILFYAVVLLFDAAEQRGLADGAAPGGPLAVSSRWLRRAFGFFVSPLCSLYIASASFEYFHTAPKGDSWVYHAGNVACLLPLLCATAGRFLRLPPFDDARHRGALAFSRLGASTVLVAALLFAIADADLGSCQRTPLAAIIAMLCLTTAFLSFAAWRFTSDPRRSEVPASTEAIAATA